MSHLTFLVSWVKHQRGIHSALSYRTVDFSKLYHNFKKFFKVKNCDFEHIELMVDERYRRKGIGTYLLYHTVKNLEPEKIKNNRLCTCIRPDNIPSIKQHELIGFKKTRRVILFHWTSIKDGQYKYINMPHYSIWSTLTKVFGGRPPLPRLVRSGLVGWG